MKVNILCEESGKFYMTLIFLCLDDAFYLVCWSFVVLRLSRACSFLNGEKVFHKSPQT